MAGFRKNWLAVAGVATLAGLSLAGCSSRAEKALAAGLAAAGDGDWSADINTSKQTAEVTSYTDDSHYKTFVVNMNDATGESDSLTFGHRESYTYVTMIPMWCGKTMIMMPQTQIGYHYYDDSTQPRSQMSEVDLKVERDIRANLPPQQAPRP